MMRGDGLGDEAYFVGPSDEPGPGLLLLPSWWGLTGPVRARADRLADAGFTVLAPDLAFGGRPQTEAEAEAHLGAANPNRIVQLVLSSAGLIAEKSAGARIGVVGTGMGGSMALWLSVRQPDLVGAAASLYGSQSIDFAGARAVYQLHLAAQDRFISADDATFLEATMRMEGLDVEVVEHAGTRHGFADPESPTHDPVAAEDAWSSVTAFLVDEMVTSQAS